MEELFERLKEYIDSSLNLAKAEIIGYLVLTKPIYTTVELADLLHTSIHRVDKLRNAGLITGIKSGRGFVFSLKEIERFMDDCAGMMVSNDRCIADAKSRAQKKNLPPASIRGSR